MKEFFKNKIVKLFNYFGFTPKIKREKKYIVHTVGANDLAITESTLDKMLLIMYRDADKVIEIKKSKGNINKLLKEYKFPTETIDENRLVQKNEISLNKNDISNQGSLLVDWTRKREGKSEISVEDVTPNYETKYVKDLSIEWDKLRKFDNRVTTRVEKLLGGETVK